MLCSISAILYSLSFFSSPLCPQWRQPRPPAERSRRESTSWRNGGGGGGGGTWRIQFEPSKSQAMAISRHRVDWPIPPVAFNGLNVADVDTLKLLGVTFDRPLHYGQHLRTIALRAARRIGFLRKAFKVLDHKGRTAAYKGFVRPMLQYCPLVRSGAADGHLRRLDKVQKRALSLLGQGTALCSAALSVASASYTSC